MDTPWVEIDLDALLHNLAQIRHRLPAGAGVIGVVKDSAYGCGAPEVARALEQAGVPLFAVARTAEARELRQAGIRTPVLVLGEARPEDLPWIAANGVHLALNDLAACRTLGASRLALPVHVNIDTGMGRLGVRPPELGELPGALRGTTLRLAGAFTHFACADEPAHAGVAGQVKQFEECLEALAAAGLRPEFVHCANSAGIVNVPWPGGVTHCRPGIMLYGCRPDPWRDPGIDLRPIASLKGHVVKVKRVAAGTPISYGWQYRSPADTIIGTVNTGYGHGLPRFLSRGGVILVGGRRCQIAGRVTMDYTMVDLGAASTVQPGDEAVAIGHQGGERITPDEVAAAGDTIAYEVLCNLGTRIPRVYLRPGTPGR